MSFQAYMDNIQAKTGNSPEQFKKLAEKKGFLEKGKLKNLMEAAVKAAFERAKELRT